MRWFLGTVVALVVAIAIYLGSAATSLSALASAARAGDGARVLERTDVMALNRSLANQIVGAYLERIGATRRVSPMEKMLINTYGATIADAMVAKMLTADNLTQMLKTGKLDVTPGVPSFEGLPALTDLQTANWLSLLGRVNLIQPVLLGIRVSDNSDPENYAAINLHFEGGGWKLSGIELPKAIVRTLAASLPVK
ncbi:DUF2939 domain-containing protein [Bradyrhizobium sp.]|uniref:DUF2939 domain-containing protein n=1 Tax=Bradyrhizobium sp. TaxID=376 RepID=UPI003C7684B7